MTTPHQPATRMTPPGVPPAPESLRQTPYAAPPAHPTAPPAGTGVPPVAPGYVSPIPIQRTGLRHALASEWTKIWSVRSTVWTLAIMVTLMVGIGLLVVANTDDRAYLNDPTTLPGLFGSLLGLLCALTLGILVITSEYSTGMIRTTFTACPARHRVLLAKVLVYFAITLTTCTAALLVVAMAATSAHSGPEVVEPSNTDLAGATIGGALYISLLGVLSLSVGAMLRHSAGAITTMLGAVLLPPIMPVFLSGNGLATVREKIEEYSAPNALAALFGSDGRGNGWSQLALLAALTVVAFGAAVALLERRDA